MSYMHCANCLLQQQFSFLATLQWNQHRQQKEVTQNEIEVETMCVIPYLYGLY